MTSLIDYLKANKDIRSIECLKLTKNLQIINEENDDISNWLTKNNTKWEWLPGWYVATKRHLSVNL
jgi:hypothetical protein